MNKVRTPHLKRDLTRAYTCEKKNTGPVLRILKEWQDTILSFSLVYISLERNGRLYVFIHETGVFKGA